MDKQNFSTAKLPKKVSKYFWGDDLAELNWANHKDYITKTILEKGDSEAVSWLMAKTNNAYLSKIAKEKRLDPKSKHFWNFYLS